MENSVTMSTKNIEVIRECDVLVVGAGTSGFAAAVSAARAGAKVILVEKNHYPGGIATSGLMCSIGNYFVTRDGTQITFGLPIEFIDRIVSEGGGEPDFIRGTQSVIPNDPEIVKRVMIKMLREAGVTTIYGSTFVDLALENGKVTHCIFFAYDDFFAVKAKEIVDSTGELSVFSRAGGKTNTHEKRSSTLLYRMGNVNIDKIIDWFEANPDSYSEQQDGCVSLKHTIENWRKFGVFHLPHGGGKNIEIVKKALESGVYSKNFGKLYYNREEFGLFACRATHNIVLINSNFYKGDNDVILESVAEEEGHLQIESQVEFLIKYFPGFENAYLIDSANEAGRRKLKTAICNKTFDWNEFKDGKPQDDWIGFVGELDFRQPPFGLMHKKGWLPLSMVVSDETPNVIVGSAKNPDTSVSGMTRGQPACLVLGRGVGVAAAIASLDNTNVVNVNIGKVQEELKRQGI